MVGALLESDIDEIRLSKIISIFFTGLLRRNVKLYAAHITGICPYVENIVIKRMGHLCQRL